jgi:cytochrome P450
MPLPPRLDSKAGLAALREVLGPRNFLGGLAAMRLELGSIFSPAVPGFHPTVLAGPEASHFALVEARGRLNWRNPTDPVTTLLRHGLLVEDGPAHDTLRRAVMPALHRARVAEAIATMWQRTDQVLDSWQDGRTYDMLVEMRRVALLILVDALFHADFTPHLDRLFPSILEVLKSISPGLWLLGAPRRRAEKAVEFLDDFLYSLIRARRSQPLPGDDLLSQLIEAGMDDDLIRDQALTLFIAGHDTSTALLAWCLYLIGLHPDVLPRLTAEVDAMPGNEAPTPEQLDSAVYLDQVISETLRLYPPIHVGNRLTVETLTVCGYEIPKGERVMVSIYATHHDETHWARPEEFDPGRFAPGVKHLPYTYLPFGGGARNCLGANFASVEARVVLARLLQRFTLTLKRRRVHLHMGATLEPRPGVFVQVRPR